MKKIISLFQRNYDGDRRVRDEVVPGAEWVLAGEGVATRKWDGTCCLVRDGKLYARYDAKKGKTPPTNFEPAQDPDHHRRTAILRGEDPGQAADGTYELCGPKVQGNAERRDMHVLVPHGKDVLDVPKPVNVRVAARLARSEFDRGHRVASPRRAHGEDQAPRLRVQVAGAIVSLMPSPSCVVKMLDGRVAIVSEATNEQRRACSIIGDGEGVHWPLVDEDISVRGLLGLSRLP